MFIGDMEEKGLVKDLEEKLDIPRWGDEYRRYMKEVPRFNFVLGL